MNASSLCLGNQLEIGLSCEADNPSLEQGDTPSDGGPPVHLVVPFLR